MDVVERVTVVEEVVMVGVAVMGVVVEMVEGRDDLRV
jgi:hypothetical protein